MTAERILGVLREQADVYRQLLGLEREKTAVIIHNEVQRLNEIIQKERKLAKQAEELELGRIQETKSYMKAIGLQASTGQIESFIVSISHPGLKRDAIALREELTEVLRETKELTGRNQLLAKQALEFIDFSLGFMMEDPGEAMVYRHPMNQSGTRTGTGLFNSRV